MIIERLLDRSVPMEMFREAKMEQFRRTIVLDLAMDEYVTLLNEQETDFPGDFMDNVKLVGRIIRFSVFNAYNDVLKYGTKSAKLHAGAVMDLTTRYKGGLIDAVVVGGKAHHAIQEVSRLVQTFGNWDYQNRFVPR